MSRNQMIEKYQVLFWYFDKNKLNDMSDSVLVEFILNYGDMQAVKDIFVTLGEERVAKIFAHSINNKRNNYFPQVRNFFDLYFKKNVPEYPFK